MSFCPTCKRILESEPHEGHVIFTCPCGYTRDGGDESRRIGGKEESDIALNKNLMEWAAVDPISDKIMEDCPNCGRDYMSLCRINNDENTIFVSCVCKYIHFRTSSNK